MERFDVTKKLEEVNSQIEYFERLNKELPNRKITVVIKQLRAVKGILEEMV